MIKLWQRIGIKQKVILTLALITFIPIITIQVFTSVLIHSNMETAHRKKLEAIERNVTEIVEDHKTKLRNYVAFLGEATTIVDTAFISTLTSDSSRLNQEILRHKIGLDIGSLEVIDLEGRVIAATYISQSQNIDKSSQMIVREALAGRIEADIQDNDGIYSIIAGAPVVRGGQIIAVIMTGIYLDDYLTIEIKERTGGEVIFTSDNTIRATSFSKDEREVLSMAMKEAGPREIERLEIRNQQYDVVTLIRSSGDREEPDRTYIALSRDEIESAERNMRYLLITVGFFTLLISLGTGYVISGKIGSQQSLEMEVKRRTKELEALASRLEQSNRELKNFANICSHDLIEPLRDEPPVITISGELIETNKNATEKARVYRLSVRDNGIGFDERHRDRIFGIFQRLHGRDKYPGTGVGLAICRSIAERHGGTIEAMSSPGKGSEIIVLLPTRRQ